MKWWMLLILSLVQTLLLVLGGTVFHFLEKNNEDEVQRSTNQYIDVILDKRPCLSQEDLVKLVGVIVTAYDQGVIAFQNNSAQLSHWDLVGSIFFAGTAATTIGYGHIAPATYGGRIFCVFFSLVAIPICLTVLATLASVMVSNLDKLEDKLTAWNGSPRLSKALCILLFAGVGVALFCVGPAAIFMGQEQWTFDESMYYTFVTLSTIGFGDYVAGVNKELSYVPLYRILIFIWIYMGLAWLSTVISLAQGVIQNLVDKADQKLDEKVKASKVKPIDTEDD